MWKLLVMLVLALAFGLAIGWYLREHKAIGDCLHAEGKWLPKAGRCSGSPYGEVVV